MLPLAPLGVARELIPDSLGQELASPEQWAQPPPWPPKDQTSARLAFALAQRALTALRALSLRCSGVILAALAGPPF